MKLKSLVKRTWVRWCAAVAGLVVIAFVSGFAFGLFDSTGIEAQSDAHPQDTILDPSMVVTPVRRVPEMDTSLNPITVHRGTRSSSDSDAGSGSTATEGAAGRFADNAAGSSIEGPRAVTSTWSVSGGTTACRTTWSL